MGLIRPQCQCAFRGLTLWPHGWQPPDGDDHIVSLNQYVKHLCQKPFFLGKGEASGRVRGRKRHPLRAGAFGRGTLQKG